MSASSGEKSDATRAADALRSYLVTKTTESWIFWYGLLQASHSNG